MVSGGLDRERFASHSTSCRILGQACSSRSAQDEGGEWLNLLAPLTEKVFLCTHCCQSHVSHVFLFFVGIDEWGVWANLKNESGLKNTRASRLPTKSASSQPELQSGDLSLPSHCHRHTRVSKEQRCPWESEPSCGQTHQT